MTDELEKTFGVNEIAAMFRVRPTTVRRWLQNDELHGVHHGRRWAVTRSEITRFFDEGSKKRVVARAVEQERVS